MQLSTHNSILSCLWKKTFTFLPFIYLQIDDLEKSLLEMDDPTTQDIHHLLDKFQKDVSINENVDI